MHGHVHGAEHGPVAPHAVAAVVRVAKDNGTVRLEVDKANDLAERPQFAFTFKSVTLQLYPMQPNGKNPGREARAENSVGPRL